MNPHEFSFSRARRASYPIVAAVAACALLGAVGTVFGQAGYSTTFDDTSTFVNMETLSGQGGWDTTDPDKTPTTPGYSGEYVGQSDYVGIIQNYSQTASDQEAFLGGLQHGTSSGATLPGSLTTYLYHDFSLSGATTSYAFNTDFAVSSSGSPYTGRDSFAWTLRSGSGTSGTNIFSLNFTPSTSTGSLNIGYSQYAPVTGTATTTATAVALPYNSRYHLTMSVTLVAGGAGLLNVSLTNLSTLVVSPIANNIALANATSVTEAAATWILANPATQDANGGYTSAGSNALIFNNYFVTIPEPSTYAMVGLGIVAAAVYRRRRVHA